MPSETTIDTVPRACAGIGSGSVCGALDAAIAARQDVQRRPCRPGLRLARVQPDALDGRGAGLLERLDGEIDGFDLHRLAIVAQQEVQRARDVGGGADAPAFRR